MSNSKEIILYSTGCPKCNVLENKLQAKGVYYTKNTSESEMVELGFMSAPMLKVGNDILDFGAAIQWINSMEG